MILRGSSRRQPLQYEIQAQPTEKAKNITPSRQRAHLIHARHTFICGRADNACTNLLGFFVRHVRTRGSMRLWGAVKLPIFALSFAARTCHALLIATNSCTRKVIFKRMENPLK